MSDARGQRRAATDWWVGAGTYLVVKLLEDTPRGSPAGSVNRITTALASTANPSLDDSRSRFKVPPADGAR